MQCTWQKLARITLRGVARPSAFPNNPFPRFHLRPSAPWGHISLKPLSTTQSKAGIREVEYFRGKWLSKRAEKLILPEPPLTVAQAGRAASAAIRISLRKGNLADGYDIVNSVRYAAASQASTSVGVLPSTERVKSLAFEFPPNISPRLPSHTLLHGLIRARMLEKAYKLAEQMMKAGITVRGKSLEALYVGLARMPNDTPQTPSPTVFMLNSSDILTLRPSMASSEGTRFALHLLQLARESRQRRTHDMFKTLMALCIINGEIIVGSLLFGILLRDWQARQLQAIAENSPIPSKKETPFPVSNRMKEICTYVDSYLAADRTDERSQHDFKTSLQALANLAYYLDQRLIPFTHIAHLLGSLYNCPRVPDKVWVRDKYGEPRQVEAYAYFHKVLERLINSLSTSNYVSAPSESNMMPLMSAGSCSTLVHYSLFHRRSAPLAETVLNHMFKERNPPIEPNEVMVNIIKRSQKLLQKSEIAREVVTRFRESQSFVKDLSSNSSAIRIPRPFAAARGLVEIARAGDNYGLSTRMAAFISSGRPRFVVDAVPSLLPGLFSTYPDERHGISSKELVRLRGELRKGGLQHAVSLGPVVLTCMLNALEKTGETTMAEKVWLWAKYAEAKSWVASQQGEVNPWCLPVMAYTVMIKVYANEAKKGLSKSNVQQPRNLVAFGWGRLRGSGKREEEKELRRRNRLGRALALDIYHSMLSMPASIEEMLAAHKKANRVVTIGKRQLEIPQPDARFFNAILDVVGRREGMAPRKLIRGRAHYERLVRKQRARFVRHGTLPASQRDPALLDIARDIQAHGFPIPLIFQKLLIGQLDGDVGSKGHRRRERERVPFALADDVSLNALEEVGIARLPVFNTRSLYAPGLQAEKLQYKKEDGLHYARKRAEGAPHM